MKAHGNGGWGRWEEARDSIMDDRCWLCGAVGHTSRQRFGALSPSAHAHRISAALQRDTRGSGSAWLHGTHARSGHRRPLPLHGQPVQPTTPCCSCLRTFNEVVHQQGRRRLVGLCQIAINADSDSRVGRDQDEPVAREARRWWAGKSGQAGPSWNAGGLSTTQRAAA